MQTVKEVLIGARSLIANVGWTQKWYARDAKGREVSFSNPDATCFCILGAIHHTTPNLGLRIEAADRLRVLTVMPVDEWNDAVDCTREEVLELFDEAIKEAL